MKIDAIPVSKYLERLNATLKTESANIIGEVSGLKLHQNGHFYFSILDKTDQSKIDCVIWRSNYKLFGIELADGLEIIVSVVPNVYKLNGRLSFIVGALELVGEGALQIAYEKLKSKLQAEGLFLESRKREIPKYVQRIGVITSKSGAVINDFLSNIGKFGFEILFVDSKVEGQDAIRDLLSAVETMKTKNIDVLVIMRGGGSLESFQAFNNEMLVKAVANFPVPVLTGIGHDKDAPLVSMVSDKNVSTPTAVANLLNFGWNEVLSKVNLFEEKIFSHFQSSIFDAFRIAEDTMLREAERIESGIRRTSDNLNIYAKELVRGFGLVSGNVSDFLKQSTKTIEFGNPERQLSKGYSIVKVKGKVLRSVKNVKSGELLDITVSDGIIRSITS